MAHHSDVGGIAPGSIAVHATEIYQEGLRIPLSKLYDGGVENTTLLRLLEANTRQPIHVLGDLRAQLAACRVGERGLTALLERYGREAHVYMDELQRLAERIMRAELAKLPDGVHTLHRLHRRRRRRPGADPDLRPRRDRGRRDHDRLRGHLAAGRRERQLSRRDGARRVLLRDPGNRARRDAELRGVHASRSTVLRAGGDGRQPRPARRLRRPRRDRLPRLRRDHGGARAHRPGPRARGRRGRADADRVRRLRRGAPAVRDDGGPRRDVGRAGDERRARGRLEPAREPRQPARRAARGGHPDRGRALRARAGLRRRGAPARRPRLRARVPGAHAEGDADDPHRPARPSSLRRSRAASRGRRRATPSISAGATRELPTMPMEASSLVEGDRFIHVSAGGGGFGVAVRARAGSGAGGRPRRQGRRSRPLASATASCIADGVASTSTATGAGERRSDEHRHARSATAWSSTAPEPSAVRGRRRPARRAHRRRRRRAGGRDRDRRRREGRRPGLHRHPQPLRLHPARRSAGGERRPPGRHARGRRELRLRLLPVAEQGARAARRSTGTRRTSR